MLTALLLFAGVQGAPGCGAPASPWPDSLSGLFQRGRTYAAFLDAARSRRETWIDNTQSAGIDSSVLARARAVSGSWELLAVAEDWCGDSANTIPYIARLVDSVPSLALRIVNSSDGRWVMERYRTPDGRAATPTIVLLDSAGNPVGCFVERPLKLREVLAATQGRRESTLSEWRRQDAGRSTVEEIVALLEAAVAGTGHCEMTP